MNEIVSAIHHSGMRSICRRQSQDADSCGVPVAGIAAAAVLTGCSAGSGSGQSQESNASTDVTQATLDDAKLTADDLCAAALQFKMLSEAGTSDEYEREYRFALAASALGNADAMLYLGEMYQEAISKQPEALTILSRML